MAKLTEWLDERSASSPVNLRAWCDEQNRKRIMAAMSRWYFVIEKDDIPRIDSLSGVDADNVRRELAGELDDFYGWPPKRMQGYRNWLRSCAEKGLLPESTPA